MEGGRRMRIIRPFEDGKIDLGNANPRNVPEFLLSKHSDSLDARVETPEEERNRLEEMYRKKITPELLTHFSFDAALQLVKYFEQTPSTPTQDAQGVPYDLFSLGDKAREFLAREVKGKKILELGNSGYKSGYNVPSRYLLGLGAQSYEGCDPKYNTDGLTFLMRQPEGSAIVCSFGVLESGVLDFSFKEDDLTKYCELLDKEVYRVTPAGSITLHGTDSPTRLIDAGFKVVPEFPEGLNPKEYQTGGLVVLRK